MRYSAGHLWVVKTWINQSRLGHSPDTSTTPALAPQSSTKLRKEMATLNILPGVDVRIALSRLGSGVVGREETIFNSVRHERGRDGVPVNTVWSDIFLTFIIMISFRLLQALVDQHR